MSVTVTVLAILGWIILSVVAMVVLMDWIDTR